MAGRSSWKKAVAAGRSHRDDPESGRARLCTTFRFNDRNRSADSRANYRGMHWTVHRLLCLLAGACRVADDLGNLSEPGAGPSCRSLDRRQLDGKFPVSLSFPVLQATMGPSLWFLYAAMGVAAFIFVVGYVPETKGKSLEDISRQWRTGNPKAPRLLNRP